MKKLFSLLALTILSLYSFAHNTGNVKGTVTEQKTGISIPGANIYIKGTVIGASSDIRGLYEIKNIQIGTYELICTSVGYKTQQKTITVEEGKTIEVNFELEASLIDLSEVSVEGDRPHSAATSKAVRKMDINLRPSRTPQDMLMMAPGLIIAQHAGGGKAEQIYIRGFDCDHGTDVCIDVDGMPVNMVTHGHGQGYADLHFLISDVVDEIEVNKGPYSVKYGDFATAASVTFKTKDLLEHNKLKVEGGDFNTKKYTFLYQMENGGVEQNGYIATQYYYTDGPFKSPQRLERLNVFGKYFSNLSDNSRLTVSAGGYSSVWNASGQIPTRAVEQGIIDRFDGIDNLEGGTTGRQNLSLEFLKKNNNGNELTIQSYLSHYAFKLFSNFTLWLIDSINGDMIEQIDHRTLYGMNAKYKFAGKLGSIPIVNLAGCGFRADNINLQLWHSPERNRMAVFTNDDIIQRNFFAYFQQEYLLSSYFRAVLGVRHDYFTFNKEDLVGQALDTINNGLPHGSGAAQKSVISPKLSLIISPTNHFDIFLNFGQGFHSNDARNIVLNEKAKELVSIWKRQGLNDAQIAENLLRYNFPLENKNTGTIPQATGGEMGIQTKLFNRLHLSVAAWYLYLDKEIVYAGDGGTMELSNSTQRQGLDAEMRLNLTKWLWIDADVCYAKGKINGLPEGENYIPLAPNLTSSGGISVLHKSGIEGTFRYRYVGHRPGNEDNSLTALGYNLLNASLSYNWKRLTLTAQVENIMNVKWNEAQFDTETRLKDEPESVSEICYTPGNPRNFQFGLSYRF